MKQFIFILCSLPFVFFSQENHKPNSGCNAPQASSYLNINNINAIIYSGGDMHSNIFSNGMPAYCFPKGSVKPASGASSIWIGGLDNFGYLKIAAQTYRQDGIDFWSGPLNNLDASIDYNSCWQYDKIWNISYNDINEFIANYNNRYVQYNLYTPKLDILNFPTTITDNNWGTQAFGKYIDSNGDGVYNPTVGGDYPAIKGDQTLYYVFNDNGSVHMNTGGKAIGVQVNAMVYAYGCPKTVAGRPELLNTTFYNYKIYNKTGNALNQAYITIWVDANIGDGQDDYVGSNPKQGYAYAYNGDGSDAIYGNILPATGTVILKAPNAPIGDGIDNDNDGIVDEVNEELLTPKVYYYNHDNLGGWGSGNAAQKDPQNATQCYQYMEGLWRDGSPFTCGGNAYNGSTTTHEVFPSTNATSTVCGITNWTEKNQSNPSGDRCYLLSMGPFTLNPYDSTEIEYAFVTSIDSSSIGNTDGSVAKLESDIIKVKSFYDLPNKPNCINAINQEIEKVIDNSLTIYPNPSSDIITVSSLSFAFRNKILYINDLLGRKIGEYTLTDITNTIDISDYTKGMYFVSVEINNKIITKKIIKE